MDPAGKLIYIRNNAVLSSNLQTIADDAFTEGARLSLSIKELGSTEIFPTSIAHSPNGRFVTVVGDGEYINYTALAWRNKSFGNGSSFAWAGDSNTYAVLEGKLKVRVYKNFKERGGAGMKGVGSWSIEGLHGGPLLGARGNGFVVFWDIVEVLLLVLVVDLRVGDHRADAREQCFEFADEVEKSACEGRFMQMDRLQ